MRVVMRAVRVALGLGLASVLTATFGGCEALVGDTIPGFSCSGTSASACPGNQICAPSLGRCIDRTSACSIVNNCADGEVCNIGTQKCVAGDVDAGGGAPDASKPMDATVMADSALPPEGGGIDAPSVCNTVGCTCISSSDCVSTNGAQHALCADSTILTSVVTGKICTQPCCASSECGADNVCFASGTGGNYCVPKATLGRNIRLGGGTGGATCGGAADCRSGLCGPDGKCLDSCCVDANCTNGTQCAYNTNTTHDVLQCAAVNPGNGPQDSTCFLNSDCHGNQCITGIGGGCQLPCCNSASCSSGDACFDVQVNAGKNDWVPLCVNQAEGAMIGSANFGDTCMQKTDCKTGHCLAGRCTDVCCSTADCAAVPTWVCQPMVEAAGIYLRCGQAP